ncbi:MAG: baseplate J/gp47 family protein [Candidatus Improbicoccus pseudotrichonymphae]|uniref:Baseplate J/gp47 family protein n=1 Tax=Candidatus Improbicoccus pseudotrichonymphae TaxID=3033792 RepID=A0AA48HYL5_9FIRM|nr:MAG: baseplate J/gp47 family protein [Candidatus Improbicoccus pseudotrichonymphae]
MIKLKNFDEQNIEEILNDAKNKINYFNPEWTYKGESDPGITILELLVWFIKIQREYINQISPMAEMKLLKLLGIKPKRNCGSKTLININIKNSNVFFANIPKGTKFLADELIFENKEQEYLLNSKIVSVKFNNPEFVSEIKYDKFHEQKSFYIFGNELSFKSDSNNSKREFYINFDRKIPKNKKINIYFEVFSENLIKKNPVNNDDLFEPLSYVKWEFYGTKNSVLGWHEIEIKDFTYGFLFSGIVSFKMSGRTKKFNSSDYYSIKVTFLKSDHIFCPQITKIIPNVFEVEQIDTHCEKVIFKKNEFTNKKIEVFTHLSLYGNIIIYKKDKSKMWVQFEKIKISRNIFKGSTQIVFENIDFLDDFESNDEVLMVVSYSNYIKSQMVIGHGSGFSSQLFNVTYKNTPVFENFELMVGEEKDDKIGFEIWKRTDDFFSCGKNDKKFVFEENISSIIFGDNVNGKYPKNCKNSIRICSIAFTSEEMSNIKSGMINSLESENYILRNSEIIQLTDAKGGRKNEKLSDIKKRALKLFADKENIITLDDYKKVIKKTPGLSIKNLKIIPALNNEGNFCSRFIYVVVICENMKYLPESYKKNVMNQIEKRRLVCTALKIIDADYIYVTIDAEIYTKPKFKASTDVIEEKIKKFFEEINLEMGKILNYVDVHEQVNKVEFVHFIKYLNIKTDRKHTNLMNNSNNIIAPPNGVYILEKINVEYLVSVNFR